MFAALIIFMYLLLCPQIARVLSDSASILAIKGSGSKTFALVNGWRYEIHLREDETGPFTFQKFPDPVVIALPKAFESFNISTAQAKPCRAEKKSYVLGKDVEDDYFILIDEETYPVAKGHLASFCLDENQYTLVNNSKRPIQTPVEILSNSEDPKVYAFYFPQFHEDALNTKLWGQGFTDWARVKSSTVNRNGQLILKPTSDLGYYDLTDREVRRRQAELAKSFGVDGFIWHHYWFYQSTEGVLAAPSNLMLKDGEPNISFAFSWANHPWTKTWSGIGGASDQRYNMLHEQRYPETMSDELIQKHYNFLKPFFRHKNYIRVSGVPLFMIYERHPGVRVVLKALRLAAIADGFPSPGLHIPENFGGGMSSHPLSAPAHHKSHQKSLSPLYDAQFYYPSAIDQQPRQLQIPPFCFFQTGREYKPSYTSVSTLFDNTPRRIPSQAHILDRKYSNCTPVASFEQDLVTALMYDKCCQHPDARNNGGKFVVVNAWNEWGEGMVLEPSQVYSYSFLEAVRYAKGNISNLGCDWGRFRHRALHSNYCKHTIK